VVITGVESLTYGVEDIALCTRFFSDWGLDLVDSGRHGSDFRLRDGSSLHIRAVDDRALPPAPVRGSTVRETVWGLESADDVEAVGAVLSDREVKRAADGTLRSRDETGYAIAFRPTARHLEPVAHAPANSVGRVGRMDERAEAALPYRIVPTRFVHVVNWVPFELERAMRFYVDRLGFRRTETVTGSGHFLRCNSAGDHHNLFLQQQGRNHGFQHIAFEVRDIDEVMMCGQHMERCGWQSHLGPGRHVVGSNVYWYFWCPAGGMVEIGCDLDYITDHWEPVDHETIPAGGSSWFVRREDAGRRPGHGEWPQYQPA
jgi:hypothetical protein